MADTKITALPANTTPVSTDVTVIIDDPGGTPVSQKITLANLMALFANPVSSDGDGLGTDSLRWSDLFLADGGGILWPGGFPVIFNSGANLWLGVDVGDLIVLDAGGSGQVEVNGILAGIGDTQVILRASTTGNPSLEIPAGTLMTTPTAGAVEADATNFYGTTDAGNRGRIPVKHLIRANATRTYTSNTNAQTIFNSPANGRITLETGTYKFHGLLYWTSMSGTSGNRNVNMLGAGTATVGAWLWHAVGVDGGAGTAGAQSGSLMNTSTSPASIVAATTSTSLYVEIGGSFEVTSAGTFIPTTSMVTAAASVLQIGSFIEIERLGSDSVVSIGQWD